MRESLGGLPVVVVEEAAEQVPPSDRSMRNGPLRGERRALIEPLVQPCRVVVGHVDAEYAPQVGFVQDQQVVQALLAGRGAGCPAT